MFDRIGQFNELVIDYDKRIGESGKFAEIGDIVEVVKGKKFPIGMKFVVADVVPLRFYGGQYHYHKDGDIFLYFYDEGFKYERIDSYNTVIVAKTESREDNPEYDQVHLCEVMM